LIFGVRYGVGTDYLNYLDIYENWGYGIDDESRIELGFATILSFCSNLNLFERKKAKKYKFCIF
jgi:hypothetical protein